MRCVLNLGGEDNHVVTLLQLERVGMQHQAGSDSYLTGAAFFKMKQVSESPNVHRAGVRLP